MIKTLLLLIIASSLIASCLSYAENGNWHTRVVDDAGVTASEVAADLSIGRDIAARVLGKYPSYDDPALIKYINLVGNTLALNTNKPELQFHFTILDTDEINTYSAPGGFVFITKGALNLIADEAELAGALAHEMAHVTERHLLRDLKLKANNDTSLLALIIGGSSVALRGIFLPKNDSLALTIRDDYKQEYELQADKLSVNISALSGYDPNGLSRYLTRIKTEKIRTQTSANINQSLLDFRLTQLETVIKKECPNECNLAKNIIRYTDVKRSMQ